MSCPVCRVPEFIFAPDEVAAVNDHASHTGPVAVNVFGGGMNDDIGAMFDGATQVW